MAEANALNKKLVFGLSLGLCLVLAANFGMMFFATSWAQPTATKHHSLVVKGTDIIASTAKATQHIPLYYAGVLDTKELARVSFISLTKIGTESDHQNRFQGDYGVRIQSFIRYNQTHVRFFSSTDEVVIVDHGDIYLHNSKLFPNQTVTACGAAECSTITVSGIDAAATERKFLDLEALEEADNDQADDPGAQGPSRRILGSWGRRRRTSCPTPSVGKGKGKRRWNHSP